MGERRGTKALELWCRRMTDGYPGVKIDNMTTSWRDGLAFCAMIHHFRPELIEFDKLNKSDVYYNNELAFRTAELHLGIPALLDAADMVTYEVPDRLSILTYLSQYYQVFGVTDPTSPSRLNIAKRPSTASEKNSLTKPPGPPAKMAHVGVPRREPCHKCGLPVFLAERLNIGQKLYHRTCLKCARCSTQLTPGSFYETEIDSEFCCEQCPDEELLLKTEQEQEEKTKNLNLLQKSLSDEEKRKSLQRYQSLFNNDLNSSINSNYKKNNFMDKFMSSQMNNDEEQSQQRTSQQLNVKETSKNGDENSYNIDDDDEDEDDDEDDSTSSVSKDLNNTPPKLPTSLPPPPPSASSSNFSSIGKNLDPGAVIIAPTLNSNDNKPPTINNLSDLINNKNEIIIINENNINIKDDEPLDANSTSINVVTKDVLINNNNNNNNVGNINVKKRLQQFESLSQNYNNSMNNRKSQINIKLNNDDVVVDNDITDTHNNYSNNKVPMPTVVNTITSDIIINNDIHKNISECANNLSDNDCIVNNENMCVLNNKNNSNDKNNASDSNNKLNEIIKEENITIEETVVIQDSSNVIPDESDGHFIALPIEDNKTDQLTTNEIIIPENIEKIIEDNVKGEEEKPKIDMEIEVETIDKEIKINNFDTIQTDEEINKIDVSLKEEVVPYVIAEVIIEEEKEHLSEEIDLMPKVEEIKISEKLELSESQLTEHKPEEVEIKSLTKQEEQEIEPPNNSEEVEIKTLIKPEEEEIKLPKKPEENELKSPSKPQVPQITHSTIKRKSNDYPIDLNPFGSDDEGEESLKITKDTRKQSLNPFGSDDDGDEDEHTAHNKLNKPPRPPPPKQKLKVSTNPFGSDTDDDDDNMNGTNTIVTSSPLRTPVPTPRITKNLPEPQPRSVRKLNESNDLNKSLDNFNRHYDFRGSTNSIASSTADNSLTLKHHSYHKKSKAPPPPPQSGIATGKPIIKDTLTLESAYKSFDNSPCSSQTVSPKTTPKLRKKRPAPLPPSLSTPVAPPQSTLLSPQHNTSTNNSSINVSIASSLNETNEEMLNNSENENNTEINEVKQRLIPLELSLLDENHFKKVTTNDIMYRNRTVIPFLKEIVNDSHEYDEEGTMNGNEGDDGTHDRQWEKMKDNKESQNRNRQSQVSLPSPNNEMDQMYCDKSAHGKWKRRKGPAPALPVPPRKEIQMLPLQAIKHELEVIEVQQQGLEKQGVMLEKMIRERCEGPGVGEIAEQTLTTTISTSQQQINEPSDINDDKLSTSSSTKTSIVPPPTTNTKEVEDLIMQLFELVNEKNELFRRQAELMYLRRQHRLEHEQADLEYEIRVLMAQPERNKTDTDKEREELLIARLVEVVQLRNEVIDCLEMDRLREAEEDMSIKQQIEIHSAKRDEELSQQTPTKLSKKEKKKQKEAKKLAKNKKMDADKDADESELTSGSSSNTLEKAIKKKKKKFLFLTN